MEDRNAFLGTEKIGKLMLRFSVPCVTSLLINALYNMVDQIFIGHGIGFLGNGATNVVYPITVISLAMALLCGDGCAAYLSICQGRGDSEDAHKAVGNLVTLAIGIGVILAVLFMIFKENILWTFGATDKNIEYAREYFHYITLGIPFFVFGAALSGTIRADGSPRFALFASLTGCIVNVILDPIAIFVLHWDMKGAALATIIGQIATAAFSFFYLTRMRSVKLQARSFVPSGKVLAGMIPLGVTSFLTQVSIVIIMGVNNNVLIHYGALSKFGPDIPLTVFGIVMKVNGLLISTVVGIAIGTQPIIGYNYGAGNYHRLKETFKKLLTVECTVGAVATVLFMCFPRQIIAIFGAGDELYMEFATLTFRVFLSLTLFFSASKAISIFLQSMGKPMQSTTLSLMRDTVISIPALLILPIFFGVEGSLFSAPIADAITLVLAIVFAWRAFGTLPDTRKA